MYLKQILGERCGCASYVIASRATHEAAIVDPLVHLEEYESILRERGFTLRYVIDTQVHADHVSGARRLLAAHPGGGAVPARERGRGVRVLGGCMTARRCRWGSCGCGCCTRRGTAPS